MAQYLSTFEITTTIMSAARASVSKLNRQTMNGRRPQLQGTNDGASAGIRRAGLKRKK